MSPNQPPSRPDLSTPPVIGHRGVAGYAPENTLAAVEKAASLGVRWVEFDVRLTRDDQPVLFHDETLARTTNGRGAISDRDWADLRTLDAGGWFGPAFAGERIPHLQEALALLQSLELGANVEIKSTPEREVLSGRTIAAYLKNRWPSSLPPPLISSFRRNVVDAALQEAPGIARALIVGGIPPDWRESLEALHCEGLHCRYDKLNEEQADRIAAAGFSLRCYTVNNNTDAQRLLSWGVDSLFSDYPDRVYEL